jgi:peptide/nickel transport system ATP-binding protein
VRNELPLLSVENLRVSFRSGVHEVEAVRGVSLALNEGEILGIAGESGSGKSVTLRAILGLLPATALVEGAIRFEGEPVNEPTLAKIRGRKIAMIFQNPSSHLDPLRRIGWQIAAPLRRLNGLDRASARRRALELLGQVKIARPEERIDAYPHEFSGGMKQRAMIATAIGPEPRVLLADEPTTALDVTVQARILELLRTLNRDRGLAIVLVSHDLGVLGEICHRVAIMRQGEIVEMGPAREVIGSPRHSYTQVLVSSQPALRRKDRDDPARAPGAEPLIEVEDLTVEFGIGSKRLFGRRAPSFRAVDGASFTVAKGDTLGIVGESGSGKSTLARSLVLLNTPASGRVLYKGANIRTLSGPDLDDYRRTTQMVFQSPYDSLNPRLTVGRALEEALARRRKSGLSTVAELLDMVELPRIFAGRYPAQLSGGQCQRIGIARALAVEPQVLIADEITSALDVTTQAQILDLLEGLRRERGLTLLYISHDLALVASLCRRVLVFQAGRIVESGATEEVLSRPREGYTQELLASVPTPLRPAHAL